MTVRADLDALRKMIGSRSTTDDTVLSQCLEAAGTWVYDRVRPSDIYHADVVQAVLLLSSRLYKRRQSPEGIASWDELGAVRVQFRDPDVERLMEQHLDAAKVWGIA